MQSSYCVQIRVRKEQKKNKFKSIFFFYLQKVLGENFFSTIPAQTKIMGFDNPYYPNDSSYKIIWAIFHKLDYLGWWMIKFYIIK